MRITAGTSSRLNTLPSQIDSNGILPSLIGKLNSTGSCCSTEDAVSWVTPAMRIKSITASTYASYTRRYSSSVSTPSAYFLRPISEKLIQSSLLYSPRESLYFGLYLHNKSSTIVVPLNHIFRCARGVRNCNPVSWAGRPCHGRRDACVPRDTRWTLPFSLFVPSCLRGFSRSFSTGRRDACAPRNHFNGDSPYFTRNCCATVQTLGSSCSRLMKLVVLMPRRSAAPLTWPS